MQKYGKILSSNSQPTSLPHTYLSWPFPVSPLNFFGLPLFTSGSQPLPICWPLMLQGGPVKRSFPQSSCSIFFWKLWRSLLKTKIKCKWKSSAQTSYRVRHHFSDLGSVDFHLLSQFCHFPISPESGRQWNCQNQSQSNPGPRRQRQKALNPL